MRSIARIAVQLLLALALTSSACHQMAVKETTDRFSGQKSITLNSGSGQVKRSTGENWHDVMLVTVTDGVLYMLLGWYTEEIQCDAHARPLVEWLIDGKPHASSATVGVELSGTSFLNHSATKDLPVELETASTVELRTCGEEFSLDPKFVDAMARFLRQNRPRRVPTVLGIEGDQCVSNETCSGGLICEQQICRRIASTPSSPSSSQDATEPEQDRPLPSSPY